jgi:acetyl esterase/lipase
VWDDQNPVHFVGHSAGAQVVRVLHQMLADKVHTRDFQFHSHVIAVVDGGRISHAYHVLSEGWFL